MLRNRVSWLIPLLAVLGLAATTTAVQASEPHWYSPALFPVGSTPVDVTLKGGFSFIPEKMPAIECDAKGNGEIWNPGGIFGAAGEGSIKPFSLECGGGGCIVAPVLTAEHLPWKTLLKGSPITDRIKAIKIGVSCNGSRVDEYGGELAPEFSNGNPSALKFTSSTGDLTNSGHLPVEVKGDLDFETTTGEVVDAKTP